MDPETVEARRGTLEELIGRVLRIGVTASSVCLGVGLVISLVPGASGAAHALLTAGLLILLSTPVGRVVISVVEYAVERDWFFVVMTSIVLLELLASVVAAIR